MSTSTILAWHFTECDQLANGDRRRVRVGHTLVHRGSLVMCESGLHASEKILDALVYAPGEMCWRVECGGEVIRGEDKLVCSRRKALWRVDAAPVLRRFARWCALGVLHLWEPPRVVIDYLTTGSESLRYAAGDVARAAARDVAWYAAWYAARAAARAAARDAAWAAARDAQNEYLATLMTDAHNGVLDYDEPLRPHRSFDSQGAGR